MQPSLNDICLCGNKGHGALMIRMKKAPDQDCGSQQELINKAAYYEAWPTINPSYILCTQSNLGATSYPKTILHFECMHQMHKLWPFKGPDISCQISSLGENKLCSFDPWQFFIFDISLNEEYVFLPSCFSVSLILMAFVCGKAFFYWQLRTFWSINFRVFTTFLQLYKSHKICVTY